MSDWFRPTTLIVFAVILLVCLPVAAQAPYLVKDINPSTDRGSSNPSLFTQVGANTFFVSSVPNEGYQLWKTDGTSAGTSLVIDRYFFSVSNMTASGARLYFVVNEMVAPAIVAGYPSGNVELWTSDGTATGTKKLRDLRAANRLSPGAFAGAVSAVGDLLADVNGTLFFGAQDDASGYGLWKTNGTPEGTLLVKTIPTCPDTYVCYGSAPAPISLINVSGALYFTTAHDASFSPTGSIGVLWKSDGTEAGTVMLKVQPNFVPANLTNVNGTLFFTARMGDARLWKTDGTEAGTVEIAAVMAQQLTNVNGTLFFASWNDNDADDKPTVELWKSDGTSAGTESIKGLCTTSCTASISKISSSGTTLTYYTFRPFYFTNLNGTLFYTDDSALWKSDGTLDGTVRIGLTVSPADLTVQNGTLYFSAVDATNGRELWKSDGTAAGTSVVKDICPGTCNGILPPAGTDVVWVSNSGTSNPPDFVPAAKTATTAQTVSTTSSISGTNIASSISAISASNGKIYFSGCALSSGCEPWVSDGTADGTSNLKNVVVNTGSLIAAAIDQNGTLLFTADDGSSHQIWRSDGTEAGTTSVKPLGVIVGRVIDAAAPVTGGTLFMADNTETGYELWKTDGTAANTVLVKTIVPEPVPGPSGSAPVYLSRAFSVISINGTVFFSVRDAAHGVELWKSDGTTDGTTLVKDIFPGSDSSMPTDFANVNGTLFFSASDSEGSALWKSDGTEEGTVLIKRIPWIANCLPVSSCGSFVNPLDLTAVGNVLFFTGGGALWKSDGTDAGTVTVLGGAGGLFSGNLIDVSGVLFFWSDDQLWKSDGTSSGTVMVKDLSTSPPIGSSSSFFSNSSSMANVNGTLFFVYENQLWKSDGTEAGTVMVKDVPAYGLVNANGVLYFAAKTDANGMEMWKSDGTDAGTVMVSDIYPGANGSWPSLLAVSGTKLYFRANDGTHGTELWALGVLPTTVSVTSSTSAITVGSSITLKATITKTASLAPAGTVTFMDGTNVLGTGTVNSSGVATLATSALTAGTHSITAVYGGDANFAGSTSPALMQLILATSPGYTLSANPTSATIRAGGSASFVITATADQYFNGTITFGCGSLPRGVTCSFTPATLSPTSTSPAQTTLVVSTTANSAAMVLPENPAKPNRGMLFFALMGGAGALGTLLVGGLSRRRRIAIALAALASLVLGLAACGGGTTSPSAPPQNGTQLGAAAVQVTATATAGASAGNTTAHTLSLTVNVQ